jgi:hypothetical protein
MSVATPTETAEWLDGFFVRLFILFGLTTRGAWRLLGVLCVLAGVIAGIGGFLMTEGSVGDRLIVGVGYWFVAGITLSIALLSCGGWQSQRFLSCAPG